MKHILMVGRSREVLAKAKRFDLRFTQFVKLRQDMVSETLQPYHRLVGFPGIATTDEWVAQARLIHSIDPFDAIGGFTETAEDIAAQIALALDLPYHPPETVTSTHDKFVMREKLRAAGLDDTASRVMQAPDLDEVRRFAEEYGYPVVLKPVSARGSLGVSIARNDAELDAAVRWFQQWAGKYPLLLEQFLEGEEWSVEAFSEQGRHRIACITRKYKDPRTCIEVGHCVPAVFEPAVEADIHRLVCATLDTVGIRMGPSHTEIITTQRGPRVVETHARLGGDRIVELVNLVTGVDLHVLWVRQVMGESVIDDVPASAAAGRYAAIRFVSPLARGVVERVDGVDAAKAMPGVQRVDVIQSPGAEIGEVHDSFSRGASVIAVGESAEEAMARAVEAAGQIRFVVACAG
ncbi:MAG: ATP-grasp domain-containing protein [Lysobacteraceae bacterium]|nr:MAG: ATP-grasp domain-containing protein [Xanthomonadaceae bacterium]